VLFNPTAGETEQSEQQLEEITAALRGENLEPRVLVLEPEISIPEAARAAARRGARFIVASGGDNTIDAVARGLVGTRAALVIVPTGTRNNIARALNLPLEPPMATRLITQGEPKRVDMGRVRVGEREIYFLELVTIGLGAAMFPAMDEAQKGDLARIGDLLATFVEHQPSKFVLNLDRGRQKLQVEALNLVVLNMPYLGANFQLASSVEWGDGLLDVFVYADLGKLDLLTHALQVAQGFTDDPRVRHLRVRHLAVETEPNLAVMVDGEVLEAGRVRISGVPRALTVMTPTGDGSGAGFVSTEPNRNSL
jgi:diacylglycerol kinase family enzyme